MAENLISVDKTYDPTWEYEVSAGEDKPTALISYTDKYEGWASRCPLVNSDHPDIGALKLDKIKASRQPGGLIKVDLSYVGSANAGVPGKSPDSEEATAKYYVQVSGREEHVLSNKYAENLETEEITALYAISNGTLADENGTAYESQITSDVGQSLLAKIKKGNTHYTTGSITYGQRKVIKSLEDLEVLKFGKQYKPPGPVGGNAKNWLYISASADPASTDEVAWQMDRQWMFSPDGWDDDLYAPSSS